jgi:ABC-type branched-subunit amino acid transport system substrate-binding protein
MAIHYSGDFGDDAAAGVKAASDAHSLTYVSVPTGLGADRQGAAIDAILKDKPDLVVLAAGPIDATVIMTQATARGFKGHYLGTNAAWDKTLLKGPAASIVKTQYLLVFPWKPYSADSPGHTAMREALGDVTPDDSYVTGWINSYALKAVLQKAAADRALDRAGLIQAAKEITSVDYEGMLPSKAGNLHGTPNSVAFRQSVIARPDEGEFTGLKALTDFASGSTADGYSLTTPCYASGH